MPLNLTDYYLNILQDAGEARGDLEPLLGWDGRLEYDPAWTPFSFAGLFHSDMPSVMDEPVGAAFPDLPAAGIMLCYSDPGEKEFEASPDVTLEFHTDTTAGAMPLESVSYGFVSPLRPGLISTLRMMDREWMDCSPLEKMETERRIRGTKSKGKSGNRWMHYAAGIPSRNLVVEAIVDDEYSGTRIRIVPGAFLGWLFAAFPGTMDAVAERFLKLTSFMTERMKH